MGRPKIHLTPEQQMAARRVWRARSKEKTANVTLDADLVEELRRVRAMLKEKLGFEPTNSQAIRFLVRQFETKGD